MDWFRSYHGAPTDPKYIAVAARANAMSHHVTPVTPGHVAAVWWAVMDRASQSDPRGSCHGFDTETLAAFFGWPEDLILSVMAALRDKKILGPRDEILTWHKRQPRREREDPTATERKRRQRERDLETDVLEHGPELGHAPSHHVTPRVEERRVEEQIKKKPTVSKKSTWKFCPDDFTPDEKHRLLARQLTVNLDVELAKFRDHEYAKPKSDPARAFSTWLRNASEFKRNGNGSHSSDPWAIKPGELDQ